MRLSGTMAAQNKAQREPLPLIKHLAIKMTCNPRIVLVNTSHPGNIGGTARAMKNMGLTELYLVQPMEFPHLKATIRAAGADNILQNAKVVSSLPEALIDCQQVFGTSARHRCLAQSLCTPRFAAEQIAANSNLKSAIVFGREKSGLSNEELSLCQYHIHIPTNPEFSSLNLAAAVQVLAYEYHIASHSTTAMETPQDSPLATAQQVSGLIGHMDQTLRDLKFIDPKQPKLLLQRLRRLFHRAQLEQAEIHILRGILSAVDKVLK